MEAWSWISPCSAKNDKPGTPLSCSGLSMRSAGGLACPHWIIVDEAQVPFGDEGAACSTFQSQTGLCDETLASTARELEEQSRADGTFDSLRHALVEAIEIRYLA